MFLSLINLDDGDGAPGGTLGSSTSIQHGSDFELIICSLKRLDLDDKVVHVAGVVVKLLSVSLLKLLSALHAVGLEDVDGDIGISLSNAVDQVICLLEVIQRIEEDEVNSPRLWVFLLDLRQHVHGGEAGQAKRRRLVEVGEHDPAEPKDIHGVHGLHLVVEVFNVRLAEGNNGLFCSWRRRVVGLAGCITRLDVVVVDFFMSV